MSNKSPATPPLWRVGQCIYCGTSQGKLSDEHLVPYGLNGPWVLRQASCAVCANSTSRFEMDVLRGLFPSARAAFGMKTRRTHPGTFKGRHHARWRDPNAHWWDCSRDDTATVFGEHFLDAAPQHAVKPRRFGG